MLSQPGEFSDFVVFVDESGDHGLNQIDPYYPVFVLCFCVFKITEYIHRVTPAFQKLKFEYFGHDLVVFHERDIRRDLGDFSFLKDKSIKNAFLKRITATIGALDFHVIACVIDKNALINRYATPKNPYDLAVQFGLERVYKFLLEHEQSQKQTVFIFEERGKKEDQQLELEFLRVCSGDNFTRLKLPYSIEFAEKKKNAIGHFRFKSILKSKVIIIPEQIDLTREGIMTCGALPAAVAAPISNKLASPSGLVFFRLQQRRHCSPPGHLGVAPAVVCRYSTARNFGRLADFSG